MSTEKQAVFQALRILITELDNDRITQDRTTQSLKKLIGEHARTHKSHQENIKNTVASSLKTAVDESMLDLKSGLSDVKNKAYDAAQTYQKHSKSAFWQVFFTQTVFFFVFLLVIICLFSAYVPTPAQISALKDQESQLLNNIQQLKDSGASAYITECPNITKGYTQLCIRIDSDQIEYTNTEKEGIHLRALYGAKRNKI